MQKQLLAIGEALIDFIPKEKGCSLAAVQSFSPAVGGAPANVCGAFVKLGGKAQMITQLGEDAFGHKIADELAAAGIDTQHILFTKKANTALAFVSLAADGNREFSFYRKPSADMLMEPSAVESTWFEGAFALHFCSVALVNSPMKAAHERAISLAQSAGALVSFDPNLRFPLWENQEELRATVCDFMPKAHILKISDEELEFLTGESNIEKALPKLWQGNTQLVIYTCGAQGAYAFTKTARAFANSERVQAVDTTGAGDAFIGSFLAQLARAQSTPQNIAQLSGDELTKMLEFSNRYCGKSVQAYGAIASYPTAADME